MAKKVIIMGGGIAGMTAAHELIERGFDVEIYESNTKYVGGKARSEDATVGPFNNIPGEHGFRFFPGFYRHLSHTMKRIPIGSGTVFNNLKKTEKIMFARDGKEPLTALVHFPLTAFDVDLVFKTLNGAPATGLSSGEKALIKEKLFQLLTSSNTRFNDEYEQTGWWYFVEADDNSPTYQNLFADGLTKSLVAAQAKTMSTRVGGSILLQLLYSMADPTMAPSRVLNGPTNEQFLIPWYDYLLTKGVVYHKSHEVQSINLVGSQIINITVKDEITNTILNIKGDYYLLAVPVEKASTLLNNLITSRDPVLSNPALLAANVEWMNGVQFYLNADLPLNDGHIVHSNSAWALTSISQVQYWAPNYDINMATGGLVKGVLSVDVSNWDAIFNGKTAKNCSELELVTGIYDQLRQSLALSSTPLPANMNTIVVGYHIGSSLKRVAPTVLVNEEPLLVNVVNSWGLMPKSWSTITNLFLAGDYVRTNTNLACMETANESARRAVNCIIDASGTGKPYAKVWKLRSWKMLMPYKWWDKKRYTKGLPYKSKYPWWLHVIAFIWAILCIIAWVFLYLFTLIFGPI
ncbi:MAG: FAD-dependent oxidoreductase [Saprospiraceae bacterium]|jgi:uncharacterized protein with NAD-binding domain and iron-sulfur cluster|nr:FAD-dependent oxidoreductase [Saprospiraceae bacterium]MBK7435374.1 FAD-dependent oxidoreductase [Saprospiraceae bacterium]MBK8510979.1 FAD-dependent oxidoreductase [Saprospiraceae bacterium]MBK9681039.1 FAD-dependent oxidoreductase [Saprospiraceae bacterium]MBP7802295.1 FAD-dependent oxidoreductase [Saprospiraceae bacterium]